VPTLHTTRSRIATAALFCTREQYL
jgi:hypothetical protein